MEQPHEQLKRGLTRSILKHGWIPRLCTVARRLSLDDYLRPHQINSFHLSERETHSVSDLTRRLSESHSQIFSSTQGNDNQALVTPLPWGVLKNTSIPSVPDLLRRTIPIELPAPPTGARNFPGAGAANPTNNNRRNTATDVEDRQAIGLRPNTRLRPDDQPSGSAVTTNSVTQTVAADVDVELPVVHVATQSPETERQDSGVQTAVAVSTISTQCSQNTSDASTETQSQTSNAATKCLVDLKDTEVQTVPQNNTRGTQCSVNLADVGIEAVAATKSSATETEPQSNKNISIQCESRDMDELTSHIIELVQLYSEKANSETADLVHKQLTKSRVLEFLKNLQSPNLREESNSSTRGLVVHHTHKDGTHINDQMSPRSVTNLRKYLRDSFTDTAEGNNPSAPSDECPPSAFGFPEETDDTLGGNTYDGRNCCLAIGPVEGRSDAQSPLYRPPPPMRSKKIYLPHSPLSERDNEQRASNEPATLSGRGQTVSLYDDGTGFRVPNATVPAVEEANISWRLTTDGTCHILGTGSFGSVAAATLTKSDGTTLDVAVKKHRFEKDRLSFIREGKMNSFLSDTGVFPEFYGFLSLGPQNNPVICLVSELYGNGVTLADVLEQNYLGSLSAWMSVAIQLADGLRKIHQKNVIFNDIKPNNILVNISRPEEPIVKYIDLGMSSYMYGITYNYTLEQLKTVPHLAPEVKLLQPTSVLSDIWGLGVTYSDISYVSQLPGLKEIANAALKDNPEDRISLDGIVETLAAIGRCHQLF